MCYCTQYMHSVAIIKVQTKVVGNVPLSNLHSFASWTGSKEQV